MIEIIRLDKEVITAVDDEEFIFGGDRLIFSGNVEKILEIRDTYQLVNATHHVFSLDEVEKDRKLRMATVGFKSSFIGRRMSDTAFEEDNNLVLVAIAREGDVVKGSPREVELKAGDTLLMECPQRFHMDRQSKYSETCGRYENISRYRKNGKPGDSGNPS